MGPGPSPNQGPVAEGHGSLSRTVPDREGGLGGPIPPGRTARTVGGRGCPLKENYLGTSDARTNVVVVVVRSKGVFFYFRQRRCVVALRCAPLKGK